MELSDRPSTKPLYWLAAGAQRNLTVATLRQRVKAASQPALLQALLGTLFWATGAYTVNTYLAAYIADVQGNYGAPVGLVLFVWGVSAATGMVLGRRLADKLGPRKVITWALTGATLAFVNLSVLATWISPSHALLPFFAIVILWGVSVWEVIAPQQARLIELAGPEAASVAISLHSSFMYRGFSLGSALGAITLSQGSAVDLGWVAGLWEFAALGLLATAASRKAARTPAVPVKASS